MEPPHGKSFTLFHATGRGGSATSADSSEGRGGDEQLMTAFSLTIEGGTTDSFSSQNPDSFSSQDSGDGKMIPSSSGAVGEQSFFHRPSAARASAARGSGVVVPAVTEEEEQEEEDAGIMEEEEEKDVQDSGGRTTVVDPVSAPTTVVVGAETGSTVEAAPVEAGSSSSIQIAGPSSKDDEERRDSRRSSTQHESPEDDPQGSSQDDRQSSSSGDEREASPDKPRSSAAESTLSGGFGADLLTLEEEDGTREPPPLRSSSSSSTTDEENKTDTMRTARRQVNFVLPGENSPAGLQSSGRTGLQNPPSSMMKGPPDTIQHSPDSVQTYLSLKTAYLKTHPDRVAAKRELCRFVLRCGTARELLRCSPLVGEGPLAMGGLGAVLYPIGGTSRSTAGASAASGGGPGAEDTTPRSVDRGRGGGAISSTQQTPATTTSPGAGKSTGTSKPTGGFKSTGTTTTPAPTTTISLLGSKLGLTPTDEPSHLQAAAELSKIHTLAGVWTLKTATEPSNSWRDRTDAYAESRDWLNSALDLNRNYHKAWNAWAVANYSLVKFIEEVRCIGGSSSSSSEEAGEEQELLHQLKNLRIREFVVAAVRGFVRALQVCPPEKAAKKEPTIAGDVLRLLTLWFTYSEDSELSRNYFEKLDCVGMAHQWLFVLPQIIARLRTESSSVGGTGAQQNGTAASGATSPLQKTEKIPVASSNQQPKKSLLRKQVYLLLRSLAIEFPHDLLFPLTVAKESAGSAAIAEKIFEDVRETGKEHRKLVRQTLVLSEELIRVSILWTELWAHGLEEASRAYFADKNADLAFSLLQPLHAMIQESSSSARTLTSAANLLYEAVPPSVRVVNSLVLMLWCLLMANMHMITTCLFLLSRMHHKLYYGV